jgi:hypothetical protein
MTVSTLRGIGLTTLNNVSTAAIYASSLYAINSISTAVVSTGSLFANTFTGVSGTVSSLTVSSINGIKPSTLLQRSGYTSTIIGPNLITAPIIVASTFITVDSPSYVIVNANASIRNLSNQYHDSFAYLTVSTTTGLLTSRSTVMSPPNGIGHYGNLTMSQRFTVSTGTWPCYFSMYADAVGTLQVADCDVTALGNMIPSLIQ